MKYINFTTKYTNTISTNNRIVNTNKTPAKPTTIRTHKDDKNFGLRREIIYLAYYVQRSEWKMYMF